jgi:DNA repair protein RecO (recombination protein O)
MIEKTEALVLRVAPFSRTSHIVTWLTPDHGRLATVVKGACRARSLFLGQYDLFYTCELLFYSRERNGLHIARECSPINTRHHLRSRWRAAVCASYFCDLLNRLSLAAARQSELYALAASALDCLGAGEPCLPFLFWFEIHLAGVMGVAPRISTCAACQRRDVTSAADRGDSPRTPGRPWLFLADRGYVLCPDCAKDGGLAVTPDVLAVLRLWQTAPSPRTAQNTRCTPKQLLAFQELLGMFLEFHLDLPPISRKLAIDLLAYSPSALVLHGEE